MLFDTHAHYDSSQFNADRDAVLSVLPGQGVGLVVNPGCDLDSSRKAVEIAEQYPFVYAAVGVHPEDCGSWQDGDVDELRAHGRPPQGGGHWRNRAGLLLEGQSPGASAAGIPRSTGPGGGIGPPRDCPRQRGPRGQPCHCEGISPGAGVFHCFSGSAEMARELVELGWMVSFTGVLTYKNARKAVEAAQAIPMDRLMIETDSPYMAPSPTEGSGTTPAMWPTPASGWRSSRGSRRRNAPGSPGKTGSIFFKYQFKIIIFGMVSALSMILGKFCRKKMKDFFRFFIF